MDRRGPSPRRAVAALAFGLVLLLGTAFAQARPHHPPPGPDSGTWQASKGEGEPVVGGQCLACHRSSEGHPAPGIGPSLISLKEAPLDEGREGPGLWLVRGFTPTPARGQRAPLLTPEDLGYGPGSLIHLRY